MRGKVENLFSFLDSMIWFGAIGSVIAVACCLGIAPVLAAVAMFGLGFVINDAILQPLLIACLVVTVISLALSAQKHGARWPVIVGALGGFGVWYFIFGHFMTTMAYLSGGLLIIAVVSNAIYRRSCADSCSSMTCGGNQTDGGRVQ
jgi:hypothetical protein